MKDSQFSRLVRIGIAASGKNKMHFWRLAGVKYPSDFSAMLGGYKRWPEDVKEGLLDEFNLETLIQRLQKVQEKRLEPDEGETAEKEDQNGANKLAPATADPVQGDGGPSF